jgi:hypothetical protein
MKFRTIIRDEESKRKQPTPSESTKRAIEDRTNDSNQAVSTSVFLYEVIMMVKDVQTDEYTQIENMVDDELSNATESDFKELCAGLRLENRFNEAASKGRIDLEDTKAENPINLNLPESLISDLEEDWGKRYWTDKLTHIMVKYINTPFDSRYDRIQFKRDIISYKQGKEATHRVLKNILDGKTDRYSEEADEIRDIITEREWWTDENMGWDDVISHSQTMKSRKVSKQKKIRILQNGLDAYAKERNMDMPDKMAVNLISTALDISNKYAKDEYLPEIDLPSYDDTVEVDVKYVDVCKTVQDSLIDDMKEKGQRKKARKVDDMKPAEVCCISQEELEQLDDTKERSERIELIDDILEVGKNTRFNDYKIYSQQVQYYKRLRENLINEKSELLA